MLLRIRCLQPPDPSAHNALFGLQEKQPGDWLIHPGERQKNGDVIFQCECGWKLLPGDHPDFSGLFVHGKRGERFLYLSWKPRHWKPGAAEPASPIEYVRRMKVHLKSVTAAALRESCEKGWVLEATVNGRATDGGPNCASVPLLDGGWKTVPQVIDTR